MKAHLFLGLGVLCVGAVLAGCPTFPSECDYGACEGDAATTDGTLPDGALLDTSIPDASPDSEPPPGCTTPDEPLKNPEKCLVDAFGAFVSPTGDDGNPGTKARPFKTIGKAIGTTQARIVVCEGSYAESVEITRNVTIISAIDCALSKSGGKAKITAAKPDYGVSIAKPASAVQLRDVEVEATDGTSTSVNSIAVLVNEVPNVKLVRVLATGKKGFDAPAGAPGSTGATGDVGKDAIGAAPGMVTSKTCNGIATIGGGGGVATQNGSKGGPNGIPENPAGANGEGGVSGANCNAGGNAGFGRLGATPPDTTPAGVATTRGGLTNTWTPANGTDGATGGPGQGGGGGAGITGGGGGGGTGGCGGTGGRGGSGGGASIALVSISSTVQLEGPTLSGGAAGSGGAGGAGGGGGGGGLGGGALSPGCAAGAGGQGARGGAGSGGAGGISVAILYKGTKPTGQATLSFGTVGAPGVGGAPGTNDGPAGVAQNELEVP